MRTRNADGMWGSGTRHWLGVGLDLRLAKRAKSRVGEDELRFTIAIVNYGRCALGLLIHKERKNIRELNGVLERGECRLVEGVGYLLEL